MDQFIAYVKTLTVMDLNTLVKALENLAGFQVGVGEALGQDCVGGAGIFDPGNRHPAVVFVRDDGSAAGQGTGCGDRPLDGGVVRLGRLESILGLWKPLNVGTEHHVQRCAASCCRPGIRVGLVAGAERQFRQGGGAQAHWAPPAALNFSTASRNLAVSWRIRPA